MIAWLKSLFSRSVVATPPPVAEHPTDVAGRAELDDELVEIDADGRIWAHGKEAPSPLPKTNILRDPHGEYADDDALPGYGDQMDHDIEFGGS